MPCVAVDNYETSRAFVETILHQHVNEIKKFYEEQRKWYLAMSATIRADYQYTSLENATTGHVCFPLTLLPNANCCSFT